MSCHPRKVHVQKFDLPGICTQMFPYDFLSLLIMLQLNSTNGLLVSVIVHLCECVSA